MPSDDFVRAVTYYLDACFTDDVPALVETARELLAGYEVDTLVGTGLSGTMIIPTLARGLDMHWMIVRKCGDNSHSSNALEGSLGRRWVFVDDLISSGATRDRVRETVHNFTNRLQIKSDTVWTTTEVGTLLYGSWSPRYPNNMTFTPENGIRPEDHDKHTGTLDHQEQRAGRHPCTA